MLRSMVWVVVVGATLSLATSGCAAVIGYDLGFEYSGATPPAGARPWLRATFDTAARRAR